MRRRGCIAAYAGWRVLCVSVDLHGCIGKTSKGGVADQGRTRTFALTLLAEEGVATVHGAAFMLSRATIRISYANATRRSLREAMHPNSTFLRRDALIKGSAPDLAAAAGAGFTVAATVADDDQGSGVEGRVRIKPVIHADDRASRISTSPPACHRGGAPGGAEGRHQIPAAGRHAVTLKEAIQQKIQAGYPVVDYALDEVIGVSATAASRCLFNAIMATVDPGDEVVIPVPSWIAYLADGRSWCEGVPVLVTLPAEQRVQAAGGGHRRRDHAADEVDHSEQSPNNPTGAAAVQPRKSPRIAAR